MDSKQSSIIQNTFTDKLKEKVSQMYVSINSQLDSKEFGNYSVFLNYGYITDDSPQYSSIELPNNLISKNSVKLILEVIGECKMVDGEILDVGCGRGGNAYTITQYFPVKQVIGLDMSSSAISFCKQNFESDKLQFIEGDAEKLPFENSSFDVITNIESSHCYPNIFKFYTEVYRVLRMGGYFLYTDLFSPESIDYSLKFLQDIGFVLEIDRDITNNVILSLNENAARHLNAFDDDNSDEMLKSFLAVPGSKVYEDMKNRKMLYKIFRLRKEPGGKKDLMQEEIEQPVHPIAKLLIQEKNEEIALQNEVYERAKKQKEAIKSRKNQPRKLI